MFLILKNTHFRQQNMFGSHQQKSVPRVLQPVKYRLLATEKSKYLVSISLVLAIIG